jgi:hypothetical protein
VQPLLPEFTPRGAQRAAPRASAEASAEKNGEKGDGDECARDHAEHVMDERLSLHGLAVGFFPFGSFALLTQRQAPELGQ